MRAQPFIAPILALAAIAACSERGPTEAGPTASGAEADAPATTVELDGGPDGVVRSTASVTEFPDGNTIPGASARIVRHESGVNAWLQTNDLTPGNVYTLWIVVFNDPSECIVPGECSLADVATADPAVGVDLLGTGGQVVGGSGKATFAGRANVGDVGIRDIGLHDAVEAQIYLVVRDHGPKLPGAGQLREFGGGCDVYACANVQDALHFRAS